MMKYVESGDGYSHSVGYEYDTINNLTQMVETINGVQRTTSYSYDKDNRVTSITNDLTPDVADDGITESYTYDGYGRVTSKVTKNGDTTILTETYTYKPGPNGTETSQVETLVITAGGKTVTYTYAYDSNGNITSVSDGTYTTSYAYDFANQLIRENDQKAGTTYTWVYDNAGNILSKKTYAYTTGTVGTASDTASYSYGDSQWCDLLTAYDGTAITYDEIGNPLSDGTWSYTWKQGKDLATLSDGTSTWTNTYNANGLRTSRTNGTSSYSYIYNGSQLVQMTVDGNTLLFTYDASGTPQTVTYNGTTYFYTTNLQGDVTAILDSTGTTVVSYTYDAWGQHTSGSNGTGTLASTLGRHNPLRYRGYVYDVECELYYLQSRYYNPEPGRFISPDTFISTGQSFIGRNMFVYCLNNPVYFVDYNGGFAFEALLGSLLSTAATAICIIAAAHCIASIAVILIDGLITTATSLSKQAHPEEDEVKETLPQQGLVEGNKDAPPVDAGKQGKHVPGHNNYNPSKSSWSEGQNGVQQTQEAWQNGTPDPRRADGSIRIGTASDGTTVRVHMDKSGAIHGYPIQVYSRVMEVCAYVFVNFAINHLLGVGWDF